MKKEFVPTKTLLTWWEKRMPPLLWIEKMVNNSQMRVAVTKPPAYGPRSRIVNRPRAGHTGVNFLSRRYVTESCPEPPFILREPQDERRVEGDDAGKVALTVIEELYF